MSFRMFHEMCPEIGIRETRSVALSSGSGYGLPAGDYAFLWGWEPLAFYRKWGDYPGAAKDAKELKGPALALLSKQSALAPALLELARGMLLSSPEYIERVQRHYRLFRGKIEG